MSRVLLADIPSLTFYSGEKTKAGRRGLPPVPQSKCIGSPCKLYQPEVVRCKNAGGWGTDVDWTCEADLPDYLRFGRVEVSCEGYDYSGDPYVAKGSCGLEYRLVEIPGMRKAKPSNDGNWVWDNMTMILVFALLAFLLYKLLYPLARAEARRYGFGSNRPGSGPYSGGGGGGGSGGTYGNRPPGSYSPPPPYDGPKQQPSTGAGAGWRPGFWSGLGLAGLGGYLYNNVRNGAWTGQRPGGFGRAYDWERRRYSGGRSFPGSAGGYYQPSHNHDDRGEGSSTGSGTRASLSNDAIMRRATGFGGSKSR